MTTRDTLKPTLDDLNAAYGEPSYLQRLAAMARGLRRPRHAKEYKAARIELQRLSAPLSAFLLPLCVVLLLILMSGGEALDDRLVGVTILDVEEPPTQWQKPEDPDPPDKTVQDDFTPDFSAVSTDPLTTADTSTPLMSPQPRPVDAVIPIKSRVVFKGVFGDLRSAGTRKSLGERFGSDAATEDAVLRALRWLKKNQQPEGSWNAQRIAMTGLAVLTFLAHGEKPGDSPEFGETIQNALDFLVRSQRPDGRFNGMDGNEYAHPIATYALCEAYGMTLNPNVKAAAEKALAPIISGQHPTGGWTYKLFAGVDKETGNYRDDTSYMGWCAQALKAAKLAKLKAEGLDKAAKLAVTGFKRNASPGGGFGYVSPGAGGLTSVGTLCLQLLGAPTDSAVKKSLDLMDSWRPSFEAKGPQGASLQYYFYYATQAKFHAGGKRWENWNKEMKPTYVKAQQIEKNAIKDDQGRDCDIGWWTNGDAHTDRPVMDTCLAALQLMVYYRYLPTTSKEAVEGEAEVLATATEAGDIVVETGNL